MAATLAQEKLCLDQRRHQLDCAADVGLCNTSTDARSPQQLDWIWTLEMR